LEGETLSATLDGSLSVVETKRRGRVAGSAE
jgi:hypothetical protein